MCPVDDRDGGEAVWTRILAADDDGGVLGRVEEPDRLLDQCQRVPGLLLRKSLQRIEVENICV